MGLTSRAAAVDESMMWEADVVPLPVLPGDDPLARPGVTIVTAGSRILALKEVAHTPSSAEGVAKLITQCLFDAFVVAVVEPREVAVRLPSVAAVLRRELPTEKTGFIIRQSLLLPLLDRAFMRYRAVFMPKVPFLEFFEPAPIRWAGWGCDPARIASFFAAAASYRASGC